LKFLKLCHHVFLYCDVTIGTYAVVDTHCSLQCYVGRNSCKCKYLFEFFPRSLIRIKTIVKPFSIHPLSCKLHSKRKKKSGNCFGVAEIIRLNKRSRPQENLIQLNKGAYSSTFHCAVQQIVTFIY
jgi:hypothetical protein